VSQDFELPYFFRDKQMEVPWSAGQLVPTLLRLRDALEVDLGSPYGTPQQRLAAAWTRVAELRLPRKAVPRSVEEEVERLVMMWDRGGRPGGLERSAFALDDEGVEREAARIRWMLEEVERAQAVAPAEAVVESD
jgi:hypothetical protein